MTVETMSLTASLWIVAAEDAKKADELLQYDPAASDASALDALLNDPSDAGLADYIITKAGEEIAYDYTNRRWLYYDSPAWRVDDGGLVRAATERTIREIVSENPHHPDFPRLAKRVAAALNRQKFEAVLGMAQHKHRAPHEQFDMHHDVLAVQNGVVDLQTGILCRALPSDWHTKIAPVSYNPDASAPLWTAFLRRIFADNDDLIAYVQRMMGYGLTAHTREQVWFLLQGSGANGKGTIAFILKRMLGRYVSEFPAEALYLGRPKLANDENIAGLYGARIALASEGPEGGKIDSARVKNLTGEDRLSASEKYAHRFEFDPRFKLWLQTNHLPRVDDTSPAFWRRVHFLPFEVVIPPEERDEMLKPKLITELEGILAWAVRGAVEWYRVGLRPPALVLAKVAEYRSNEDVITNFITERCKRGDEERATARELYESFAAYCEENTDLKKPPSKTMFGTRLSQTGIDKFESSGVTWRLGVSLK